jgi:hypothetical protein
MKTQSNAKAVKGDVDLLTHVGITDMVYEIHRRSHHYSLKAKSPEAYTRLLNEVKAIDIAYVKDAYEIYRTSQQEKDEKLPHPNYFLAICKRLAKEKKKEYSSRQGNWGKVI